jgi:hypothetical protein
LVVGEPTGRSTDGRGNEVGTVQRERADQDLGALDGDAVRLRLRRPLQPVSTRFRADLEAGEVSGFTINQSFLLGTTVYVVIPSLMVFAALILRPRVNRIANIALGIVYALTIIAGAIGDWGYYILGSAIEVALLAAVVYYAWTWPKATRPVSTTEVEAAPHDIESTAP